MATRFGAIDVPVRAAADLGATLTDFTDQIACLGFAQISWHLVSSGAVLPSAVTVQVSQDDASVASASSTWQDVRTNIGVAAVTTDATTTAANAGGSKALLFSQGGANIPSRAIPWKKARLKMVGDATNPVTALAIAATAYTWE